MKYFSFHTRFAQSRVLIFAALLLLISPLFAQQTPIPTPNAPAPIKNSQPGKVYLLYADSLLFNKKVSADYQVLKGHVQFRRDSMFMYCDSAYFYEASNSFNAFGNVRMEQGDTLFVYSDSLYYDGNAELARLRDNVRLINRDVTLYTDSLNYDQKINVGYYIEGGKIENGDNVLTSLYGQYSPDTKQSVFQYNVVLQNPRFQLNSDTLEYNTDNKIADILGPSEIVSDSNTIYSSYGWYNTATELSMLLDRSVVVSGQQKLTGDTIFYNRANGFGEVFGNMQLTDTLRKVRLEGQYGYYEEHTQRAFATDSALVIEYKGIDTFYLHADTLKMYNDTLPKPISEQLAEQAFDISAPDSSAEQPSVLTDSMRQALAQNAMSSFQSDLTKLAVADSLRQAATDSVNTAATDSTALPVMPVDTVAADSTALPVTPVDTLATDSVAQSQRVAPAEEKLSKKEKKARKKKEKKEKKRKSRKRRGRKSADAPADSTAMPQDTVAMPAPRPPRETLPLRATIQRTLSPDSVADSLAQKLDVTVAVFSPDTVLAGIMPDSLMKLYVENDTIKWDIYPTPAADTLSAPLDSICRVMEAFHGVRFIRGLSQGVCDSLIYIQRDSMMRMYRDPVLWNDNQQIFGDSVQVFVNDSTIDRVYIPTGSFSARQLDSLHYDQISGTELTAFFANNEIRRVEIKGNLEIIYYPVNKDSSYMGLVNILSSQMTMYLKEQKMERMVISTQSQGVMTPLSLVTPGMLYLSRYVWYDYRRPKSRWDLFQAVPPRPGEDHSGGDDFFNDF